MKILKSWQFMVGFFVVLCVAAVGLTWWGVTHNNEPGLTPGAHRWDHTPLVVWGQTSDGESHVGITNEQVRVLHRAVDVTNERLGFSMLSYDDRNFRGWVDIVVDFGGAVGDVPHACREAGGEATNRVDRGTTVCDVLICNTGTAEVTQLVLQHELGHCLGLAHDPGDETSIMRLVQTETPMGEFPARIDDHDRSVLRALYGPQ